MTIRRYSRRLWRLIVKYWFYPITPKAYAKMADVVNKVYFIFLAATASITGSTGWLTLILPDLIGLLNSLDNQESISRIYIIMMAHTQTLVDSWGPQLTGQIQSEPIKKLR